MTLGGNFINSAAVSGHKSGLHINIDLIREKGNGTNPGKTTL